MRCYPLIFVVILLVFFSCKKTDYIITPSEQYTLTTSMAQSENNTVNPIISIIDTVPPANAVNIKKYGAIGNGTHDDTYSLQTALNSETTLVLPPGTYIINNTLNMRPGVKLYGSSGAIIKAGINMQGTLLSRGMYFYINNVDNSLISNIKFQQSARPFRLGDWANACIYIINSRGTAVNYNNFDFNLPYAKSGLEAVWVSGSLSANNTIKGNKLTSVGIEYAENGANSTLADGNYINHAPNDGLSAHGNSDTYCYKNIVINNIIENSGLMGIEDWGKMDGTVIKNNIITGVGKDPAQEINGIGISAVGINSRVIKNSITDAPIYYIESGGHNIIDSNIINDTKGKAIGIIGNFTAQSSASVNSMLNSNIMSIAANKITGCYRSIVIFGNYSPNVSLIANVIINPVFIGINIDSASPLYAIDVSNNKISFTIPNVMVRKAFESYTSLKHTGSQNIILNNNIVAYALTAGGGPGLEYGFEIGTDNTVINANQFYGNYIRGNQSPVYAISGSSNPVYDITLTNNKVYGAIVNLKDFTIKAKSGNNF